MFGLKLPEQEEEERLFRVVPENMAAVNWFLQMQTQWRTTMNGLFGMDYGVFLMWAKEEGLKRSDRLDLLADLRMMEGAFLAEIHSGKSDP